MRKDTIVQPDEKMQIAEAIAFLKRYLDEEVYTEKCVKAHQIAVQALMEKKERLEKAVCHDSERELEEREM